MSMLLSKKTKNAEGPKGSTVDDKMAKGIAAFLLSIQNRFASFLSGRINKLTKLSKQVCLVVFSLVFGGFSICAFVGAFLNSETSGKTIRPDQLAMPKYYHGTDSKMKEGSINETDIMRINRFKKYMDSLKKSADGRNVYDSILKTRPGLMDSIQIIEEIYYSRSNQ